MLDHDKSKLDQSWITSKSSSWQVQLLKLNQAKDNTYKVDL